MKKITCLACALALFTVGCAVAVPQIVEVGLYDVTFDLEYDVSFEEEFVEEDNTTITHAVVGLIGDNKEDIVVIPTFRRSPSNPKHFI
ncbi:MAG: hypothetical protein U9N48_02840 [Euryarchaeota archaeon]|nr:hypothetical protein [Euryarchaeota archaeon]